MTLDESCLTKHAAAGFFSYSLPGFPLPLNRTEVGGPLNIFTPHNVREGFHALYPLVQYRGRSPEGAKARALAEESIAFIQQHWSPGAAPKCGAGHACVVSAYCNYPTLGRGDETGRGDELLLDPRRRLAHYRIW